MLCYFKLVKSKKSKFDKNFKIKILIYNIYSAFIQDWINLHNGYISNLYLNLAQNSVKQILVNKKPVKKSEWIEINSTNWYQILKILNHIKIYYNVRFAVFAQSKPNCLTYQVNFKINSVVTT